MIKTIGIAVATLAFSAVAWGQNAAPLSQEDIFRLEAASDPQIAPDGRRIAYVRRSNDIETDQTRNAVWLVEADGSAHARLVPGEGETSNPRWSPDGTRIAFVHTKDDHSTIEVLNLADGSQRSIASLSTGQSGLAWSPDGSHLAWAAFQPGTGPAPRQPAPSSRRGGLGCRRPDRGKAQLPFRRGRRTSRRQPAALRGGRRRRRTAPAHR